METQQAKGAVLGSSGIALVNSGVGQPGQYRHTVVLFAFRNVIILPLHQQFASSGNYNILDNVLDRLYSQTERDNHHSHGEKMDFKR